MVGSDQNKKIPRGVVRRIRPEDDNREHGRTCMSCGKWQEWSKYHARADSKYGRAQRCMDCRNKCEENRYNIDPEASKAKLRERYKRNAEANRIIARVTYWSDPEKARAIARKSHAKRKQEAEEA